MKSILTLVECNLILPAQFLPKPFLPCFTDSIKYPTMSKKTIGILTNMLEKLLIIEDQYKEPKLQNQKHAQGKQLKSPCHLHKGNHKWSDCREKPKNKRNNKQANRDNNQEHRNRQNGNYGNTMRKTEIPKMEMRMGAATGTASAMTHQIMNPTASLWKTMKDPSAEILITVPKDKGHKQYKTYLGLVDTGTSSS
jgi:hypothetical protein